MRFQDMWAVLVMVLVTMVTASVAVKPRCKCYPVCCMKSCDLVWVLLMLSLTVCSASNNNGRKQKDERTCNRGNISPKEPYFLEGEDIVLNCSRPRGSWKRLTFVRGSESEEVPQKYITKLNSSSIQLRIPNITKEDVAKTRVSTNYRCINKKFRNRCYDDVYVRLEYDLHAPVNLRCRDYNFDNMACTWSLGLPSYHQGNAVSVTCDYMNVTDDESSLQFNSGEGYWESCPDLNNTSCRWNDRNYPAPAFDFDVKVTVLNRKRNNSEVITKTFNKFDIVEPAQVHHLTHTASGRCVEMNWKKPKRFRSFGYIITYKSSCSDEKVSLTQKMQMAQRQRDCLTCVVSDNNSTKTFSENVRICDLVPHTRYNISVKARVVTKDKKQFVERGYWSSPMVYEAVTKSDVLDVNPITLPGLYDISTKLLGNRTSSLHLYWKPLAECDLHDAADIVTYRVTAYNRTVLVTHPAFTAQIDIPESKIVNVTLQASNSIGHPGSTRVVTVFPGIVGPSPSELVIQYNGTNDGCITMAEVIVRENSSSFLNITHTLVWCEGIDACQKPLKWKELGVNVTSFVLPGNLCNVDYRYGLVTYGYSKGQIVDTGIQWEQCIYQLGKVPDMLLTNVMTSVMDHGFSLRWSHYDCDEMKAYITHYNVKYCQGNGEENCKCTEAENHRNVSRQDNEITIGDLMAGSKVCVWVSGISKAGRGPVNGKVLTIPDQSDALSTWIIVVGAVVFVALVIVMFFIIRYCYKRYKHLLKGAKITIPPGPLEAGDNQGNQEAVEAQLDSNTRLLDGIDTGSGPEYNNVSQGTESTGVQNSSTHHPLINDDDDERNFDSDISDVIDGYKKPDTFYADESGICDETGPFYTETEDGFNTFSNEASESQKIVEKQTADSNVFHETPDKKDIAGSKLVQNCQEDNTELEAMPFLSDNHLSCRNLSETQRLDIDSSMNKVLNSSKLLQNNQEEAIELQSLSADCPNQLSESQEIEEDCFENIIVDLNNKSTVYKGFDSGSTIVDSSVEEPTSEVGAVELVESGSQNGNIDVCEQSNDRLGSVSPTCLIPDQPTNSSAIEHHSEAVDQPVRHYSSEDWPEDVSQSTNLDADRISSGSKSNVSEASGSEDENDITDSSSTGGWFNEDDDSVCGYKRSEDISSLSGGSGSKDSISDISDDQNGPGEQTHSNENSNGDKNETLSSSNSSLGSGNHGSSAKEVPSYIIKTDKNTFAETEVTKTLSTEPISTDHKSPDEKRKKSINGVITRQS